MRNDNQLFEWQIMRRLDGAYNLAHSYMGNPQDAEDAVQESVLKAYKAFSSFRGEDCRSWFFKIVKNTCIRQLESRKRMPAPMNADEMDLFESPNAPGPEAVALANVSQQIVREELAALPLEFREVIVLREFDDMNYAEIASVLDVPIGTVMSRLSRARSHLIGRLKVRLEVV